MTARENEIGRAQCPVCRSPRARLRVSAKGLAYLVCDACNAQVFARSDRSDELLRAMHKPEPVPESAPAAAPQQAQQPARPGWGVLSWS
jgi:hypothetical protein